MRTPYSQQVESHCRDIAEQRNIGGRENRIIPIRTIKSGSHQAESQFGIRTIMRPANDAEVKLLLLLVLIGIIKIIKELREETLFLYCAVLVLRYRIY